MEEFEMKKEDRLLTDAEIEMWLEHRLGSGNRFEQFNRQFCQDLNKAQDAKSGKIIYKEIKDNM